jgi:hypothetical protein
MATMAMVTMVMLAMEIPRRVGDALRGHVMFWKVPRKFPGGYVRL